MSEPKVDPTGAAKPASTEASSVKKGKTLPTKNFAASSSDSSFRNIGDLKAKAPDLYELLMKGIAERVRNSMESHQRRMKKLNRESRRNG